MRLIDADEATEYLKNKIEIHRYYHPYSKSTNMPLSEAIDAIEQTPTIEAGPVRRGRWESDRLITTSGSTYGVNRCSLCEAYYQDIGYGFKYCPNCGAKMEGD